MYHRAMTGYLAPMLLLAACTAPEVSLPDTEPTEDRDDTGYTSVLPAAEEEECPTIFHQDQLPDLRLQMTDSEWAAIQADYHAYTASWHPATFSWQLDSGGTIEMSAEVRLRGNPGFSWIGDKMQFLIAFDRDDPDARMLGLRALVLDASWYNPTILRDRLAYAHLRSLGIPAPCANNATLTVNGDYYGLFTLIERLDHEYLERVFGADAADGGLWEGGYDLDSNPETADSAALSAYLSDPSVAGQLTRSDLAANVQEWAAEAVIPQNDGYWCCSHNYYLYDHPTQGFLFLPWDLDYSFDTAPWSADPDTFYRDNDSQPHLEAVRADPEWYAAWLDALATANAAYDPEILGGWVDEWSAQTADEIGRAHV